LSSLVFRFRYSWILANDATTAAMEGRLESKRARGLLRIESRESEVKARNIVKSSPVFAAIPMKAANMRIGLIMGTQFTVISS
jgi:hypothetical protein